MRRKLTWVVWISVAIGITALYTGHLLATPASGFVGTTLAMGRFGEIDVFNFNQVLPQNGNVWLSLQKAKGLSDVYVQSNVWEPGGSTGWHTHPAVSLIIVTAGTVSAYDGDDPTCKPTVYTQGMGFVDPGGEHVHILRNEGGLEARTVAIQLIPADAVRRIDADNPRNCGF